MTTLLRGICVASLLVTTLVTLGGCDKFRKKSADDADAGDPDATTAVADPDAGATPPPAVPTAAAANEQDVARFPDETKLADVTAALQRFTNVREVPQSGKVVASLNKGVNVTQIASRKDTFLVVFDNPKDTSKKLMGWIPADSFVAPPAVDAGIVAPKCAAGETALISDAPFCGKVCAADTDCPAGQACKGASNKLVNGKTAEAVTVCVVFNAPAKPTVTKVDPVAPATPPVTPTPATPAAPAGDVTAPPCGVDQILVKQDNKCHKKCRADNACTGGNKCLKCSGVSVCAAAGLCK